MIKFIDSLKKENLNGKKVLLRVDFDLPLAQQPIANNQLPTTNYHITDDFRIKAHKETINYLLENRAKILLVSHLGHDDSSASFNSIVEQISEILERKIIFVPFKDFLAANYKLQTANLYLLDNIRQDPREEKNDEGFALELSKGFDFYVNDAFAVCHREHASVSAITKHLPSFAGFLVKKEIENLSKAVEMPPEGKVLVLGGAKISTKLPIIKNFLEKAEKILIGGALANNFFKAKGIQVGSSAVDDSVAVDMQNSKIILPQDFLISQGSTLERLKVEPFISEVRNLSNEEAILDIGPETAKNFSKIISESKMAIWNGPMGLFEVKKFLEGTKAVAQAVVQTGFSIIGGGDTIAAAGRFGLLDKYSFVSTGGGAMLEFLADNRLPGLEALKYYD